MASGGLGERWGIIGHDWAVESLDRAVASGRSAQAILLTGPHGIGKTTLARALARRIQCTGANPPCGSCVACVKSVKGVNPDVRVLEGGPSRWKLEKDGFPGPRTNDREKRTLKIDQIRELQGWLSTAPFENRNKIVVLRRFEEAQEEAANAFLKTLEEPPSHATIILTAQEESLLLSTIVSRCQRLALRPLALDQVEQALRSKWKADPERAQILARVSAGRIGWAIRASRDRHLLEEREEALDGLAALLGEGRAERMLRAADLAREKETIPQLLELWLAWWRDVLLLQTGGESRIMNVDRLPALASQANSLSVEQTRAALEVTRAAQRQFDQNANLRLLLEYLALRLP